MLLWAVRLTFWLPLHHSCWPEDFREIDSGSLAHGVKDLFHDDRHVCADPGSARVGTASTFAMADQPLPQAPHQTIRSFAVSGFINCHRILQLLQRFFVLDRIAENSEIRQIFQFCEDTDILDLILVHKHDFQIRKF